MSKSGKFTCLRLNGTKYFWVGDIIRDIPTPTGTVEQIIRSGDDCPKEDHDRWVKVNKRTQEIIKNIQNAARKQAMNEGMGEEYETPSINFPLIFRQACREITGFHPVASCSPNFAK